MGKNTVRFTCQRCMKCCTDVICLPTPADVIRIAQGTRQSPRDFLEFLPPDEIEQVAASDPTWLKCNGERYIMALKRDPRRGCYFLDRRKKRCTIYEHRPILCRLFPFKLQETREGAFRGFTLHKDTCCPAYQGEAVPTGPLYGLYREDCGHHEDYNELVRVFNQKRYKGKRPEDFLAMFIDEGAERRAAGNYLA